jgi:transcription antitermination factor NusG
MRFCHRNDLSRIEIIGGGVLTFWSHMAARKINRAPVTQRTKAARIAKASWRKKKRFAFPDPSRAINSGLTWYAIEVAPNSEARTSAWLEQNIRGCQTLIPLEIRTMLDKRKTRRAGKFAPRVSYAVPVLPRIVLAGFDEAPNWLTVRSLRQVIGVMGCRGAPLSIPERQVMAWRSNSGDLRRAPEGGDLKTGLARIVASGAFTGLMVEIVSIDKIISGRVMTRQSWFGGAREVEMDAGDLAMANMMTPAELRAARAQALEAATAAAQDRAAESAKWEGEAAGLIAELEQARASFARQVTPTQFQLRCVLPPAPRRSSQS